MNIKIVSGSNGSGKSLYLSKLYKENEVKSIFVILLFFIIFLKKI